MPSFSDETLMKAKSVANAKELLNLAKENGTELTLEQAQLFFTRLSQPSGELADEELDNVSGGACSTAYTMDGVRLVSSGQTCEFYECKCCQGPVCLNSYNGKGICLNCQYFEHGLNYGMNFSLCMNPKNYRQ